MPLINMSMHFLFFFNKFYFCSANKEKTRKAHEDLVAKHLMAAEKRFQGQMTLDLAFTAAYKDSSSAQYIQLKENFEAAVSLA